MSLLYVNDLGNGIGHLPALAAQNVLIVAVDHGRGRMAHDLGQRADVRAVRKGKGVRLRSIPAAFKVLAQARFMCVMAWPS